MNDEIPSGPKPSINFPSQNFQKNKPNFFEGFIKKCSIKANKFQSGFIYQYAFVMLLGFSALLTFLIVN